MKTKSNNFEFTNFNKKQYLKDFEKTLNSKTTDEVNVIYRGYLEIYRHFKEYTRYKYGSCKRYADMHELMEIIQDTLIIKLSKDK